MTHAIFVAHGALNMLAFIALLPAAAVVAAVRDRVGPRWLQYHKALVGAAAVAFATALALALYGTLSSGRPFFASHAPHKVLGLATAALFAAQLMWARFGRRWAGTDERWYAVHRALAGALMLAGAANVALGLAG